MNKKLADDDCRMVDLLLDNGSAKASPLPDSAISLEKVLSLLHALPVSDPPADLKARTLNKIDAALAQIRAVGPEQIGESPIA